MYSNFLIEKKRKNVFEMTFVGLWKKKVCAMFFFMSKILFTYLTLHQLYNVVKVIMELILHLEYKNDFLIVLHSMTKSIATNKDEKKKS